MSMTPEERDNPEIINGSRRKRIADGSGTNVAEVNKTSEAVRDYPQDDEDRADWKPRTKAPRFQKVGRRLAASEIFLAPRSLGKAV